MMWSIVIGSLSQWAPTLGTNLTEEINHQHMIQELQSTARYTAGKPIFRLLDAACLMANTKSSRNDRARETKDIRARYQPWGASYWHFGLWPKLRPLWSQNSLQWHHLWWCREKRELQCSFSECVYPISTTYKSFYARYCIENVVRANKVKFKESFGWSCTVLQVLEALWPTFSIHNPHFLAVLGEQHIPILWLAFLMAYHHPH